MLTWRKIAALLLLAGVAAAQAAPMATAPATKSRKARSSALRGKSSPPPALVEAPQPPRTPAEMPAVAPEVTYQNGYLSISAPNSTLADILLLVKRQTGAVVEFPPSAGNERVVAKLGPAAASDVLAKLLNGSKYDYIILGSIADPRAVQRLLLTQKQGGPEAAGASAATPASPLVLRGRQTQPEEEPLEDQPEEVSDQPNEEPPPPPQPAPTPPGVKTPEQLLEELQRMQQQQQQRPTERPQQNPPTPDEQ